MFIMNAVHVFTLLPLQIRAELANSSGDIDSDLVCLVRF